MLISVSLQVRPYCIDHSCLFWLLTMTHTSVLATSTDQATLYVCMLLSEWLNNYSTRTARHTMCCVRVLYLDKCREGGGRREKCCFLNYAFILRLWVCFAFTALCPENLASTVLAFHTGALFNNILRKHQVFVCTYVRVSLVNQNGKTI